MSTDTGMPADRYAEQPIAEQIAEAETRLARLELELAHSGGARRDHRAVEHAEQYLDTLKARAARQERMERAQARREQEARGAVKAHADAVKKHGAPLKREREALEASGKAAEDAVRAAREAFQEAQRALRGHSDAVAAAAGRLEGLGLPLVDEFGNRFEVGGRTELGRSVVRLGGDSFQTERLDETERRLSEMAREAVQSLRPDTSSWRSVLREARNRREAGRQAEADRARKSVAVRRPA
ncbi:hypothetical protein SMCF_1926 [Streptomyces coelicoflavus ZG0656]|nr:hypothetical protein SMCF_1926 [Streptomyces coelicoflavus ZG0656]MZE44950.1 hypothetical protein [Streptomyces sp. SID5477]